MSPLKVRRSAPLHMERRRAISALAIIMSLMSVGGSGGGEVGDGQASSVACQRGFGRRSSNPSPRAHACAATAQTGRRGAAAVTINADAGRASASPARLASSVVRRRHDVVVALPGAIAQRRQCPRCVRAVHGGSEARNAALGPGRAYALCGLGGRGGGGAARGVIALALLHLRLISRAHTEEACAEACGARRASTEGGWATSARGGRLGPRVSRLPTTTTRGAPPSSPASTSRSMRGGQPLPQFALLRATPRATAALLRLLDDAVHCFLEA